MNPAMIEALVILLAKYGPGFVLSIKELFTRKEITAEEVFTLFEKVQPYEAYGIPAAALVPVTAAPR